MNEDIADSFSEGLQETGWKHSELKPADWVLQMKLKKTVNGYSLDVKRVIEKKRYWIYGGIKVKYMING